MSYLAKPNLVLLSNSAWNMIGQGGALLVALGAIPILLRKLGPDAFGLFTVYLALIGFSGILDLGLGRAITAAVARNESNNNRVQTEKNIVVAIYILIGLGISLAVIFLICANPISNYLVGGSTYLLNEAINAFYVLSIGLPIVLVSSALRGALEGFQEFKAVAKITLVTGALMYGLPAALSFITTSISYLMVSILLVRTAALVMFYITCKKYVDIEFRKCPARTDAVSLIRQGGWMTVSNVASPIMTNLDRLFVSSQISPAAAAIHVAAYEFTTKVLLVAGSVANASFPVLSIKPKTSQEQKRLHRFFWRAMLLTSCAAILPSIVIFTFASDILTLWISAEFADGQGTQIAKILAIGVALNGLAYIPFAYIQGMGRADVVAKFHIFELLLFIPTLLYALEMLGVVGAAVAWTARVGLDCILLIGYCSRKFY